MSEVYDKKLKLVSEIERALMSKVDLDFLLSLGKKKLELLLRVVKKEETQTLTDQIIEYREQQKEAGIPETEIIIPKIVEYSKCPYCESEKIKVSTSYKEERLVLMKCSDCGKVFYKKEGEKIK